MNLNVTQCSALALASAHEICDKLLDIAAVKSGLHYVGFVEQPSHVDFNTAAAERPYAVECYVVNRRTSATDKLQTVLCVDIVDEWHRAASTAMCIMPGFHHSVAVLPLPFPFAVPVIFVAVSVQRCRCRCRCIGSSASMIGWPATEQRKK